MTCVGALDVPLALPCGAVMPNRLVKAPMEQMLAKFQGGKPNQELLRLYHAWAEGAWGMIVTGNVGVDRHYIGLMFDFVLPDPAKPKEVAAYRAAYQRWARVCTGRAPDDPTPPMPASEGARPLAIVQLVHCGPQSIRGAGRMPWQPSLAPSAVPVSAHDKPTLLERMMFGTPRALSLEEIHEVIARFVQGAVFCAEAGFDGVELHAAHGYLLSSFLSPVTNQRTDAYGGSAANRFRIVQEIVDQTRARVPASFALGIKLNSSDFMHGGLTEEDALQNVQWLAATGKVDFVEVSGGTYIQPKMFQGTEAPPMSERTKRREGFFVDFAQRCHETLHGSQMRIIVTGGMRSRTGMADALRHGAIDAVGLGRPAALDPHLPRKLLDPAIPDTDARAAAPPWKVPPPPAGMPNLPLAGAGWNSLWHAAQLHRTAYGEPPTPDLSLLHFLGGLKVWRE